MDRPFIYPEWCTEYKVDYEPARSGPWPIKIDVCEGDALKAANFNTFLASLTFGGRERTILPGEYRVLNHDARGIVMSDTPTEIYEMRSVFSYHKSPGLKSILINGLGLAILPRALLKLGVASIDIVEIDLDVIRLTGGQFAEDERVRIHHADAFKMKWTNGERWDYVWHDIWDSISADNVKEVRKLLRKYKGLCDGQSAWAYQEAINAARRWGR